MDFSELWTAATQVWLDGGWAMIAIAVIAVAMFGLGCRVSIRLASRARADVAERDWRRWVTRPRERRGRIGALLDFVSGGKSVEETMQHFEQLRATELHPFERDLKLMAVCVGAAPLVGLLGTVTGMLATFGALATGSGGDETMKMIASGISEALVTTMTGLVIALPGVFFQYLLSRRLEVYKVFLSHVENVFLQERHQQAAAEERESLRRAALQQIAQQLHEASAS